MGLGPQYTGSIEDGEPVVAEPIGDVRGRGQGGEAGGGGLGAEREKAEGRGQGS